MEWKVSASSRPRDSQLSTADDWRPALGLRRAYGIYGQYSYGALRTVDPGSVSRSTGSDRRRTRLSGRSHLEASRRYGCVGANTAYAGFRVAELASQPRLLP